MTGYDKTGRTGLRRFAGALFGLLLAGCSSQGASPPGAAPSLDYNLLLTLPGQPISYEYQVRPVLERRCVVCHGCYDAPCQLKLSSHEGIARGASKQPVYDGGRLRSTPPTRLFIDARGPAQWRDKGFHAVLNEAGTRDPERNLADSLLYRLLHLKQRHPQPRIGRLSEGVTLGLERAGSCPTLAEFDDFAREHPDWGMPYAMPNLRESEYRLLVQWIAQGAPRDAPPPLPAGARRQVEKWEAFLNGDSLRERLVSRYLYEHLFLAHIHFENTPARLFFRLVRSRTPPGQPVEEIPSLRPYDDPGVTAFYYRFRRYTPSIVAKNHVVYPLSDARLRRYGELFFAPDYAVTQLPPYQAQDASNPLKVFAAIPPLSRYRFLLDDARFFIENFIKGPVCRGQIALNVIEDRFWVVFINPAKAIFTGEPEFLDTVSDYLQLPAERGDDVYNLFSIWTDYWQRYRHYVEAREARFREIPPVSLTQAMDYIWDGDGHNPDAGLTIFRHFDSASVRRGLLGDYPETAWVIDYPLFERIYYLLVAGFNVYGNAGHQLNTRLYMNFLRMEGEDNFLAFLPPAQRAAIRESWYAGLRSRQETFFSTRKDWLSIDRVSGYRSADPQRELYRAIQRRLAAAVPTKDDLNRCESRRCRRQTARTAEEQVDNAMRAIAGIHGRVLQVFPDVALVRVQLDGQRYRAYSLIRDKAYKNLSSFLDDGAEAVRDLRDIEHDRMTVLRGIEGAYPNFFYDVPRAEIGEFVRRYRAIRNEKDYERFVARFGVRRTRPDFWEIADWFQQRYAQERPKLYGLLDLNRYHNR